MLNSYSYSAGQQLGTYVLLLWCPRSLSTGYVRYDVSAKVLSVWNPIIYLSYSNPPTAADSATSVSMMMSNWTASVSVSSSKRAIDVLKDDIL
jgi:hypothetical protein